MLTVVAAHNPLDRSTWKTYEQVESLPKFLLEEMAPLYGGIFPATARIYRDAVDHEHDITPKTAQEAEMLYLLPEGKYHFVVWPAGEAMIAHAAIGLGMYAISSIIKAFISPDEKVSARRPINASPNNQPGDRQNQSRILERVPDIYGTVKCTPDLISSPYIHYENNLQVETSYMCIGQGEYSVAAENIREGDIRIDQIPGAAVQIYPPGEAPGGGTPQLSVGETIADPLYTTIPVKAVTGEVLLAPNNIMLSGDSGIRRGIANPDDIPPAFSYPSTGVGKIVYYTQGISEGQNYVTDKLAVGDRIGLEWTTQCVTVKSQSFTDGAGGSGNRPVLGLRPISRHDDAYVVTSVDTNDLSEYGSLGVTVTVSVPASKQSEWDKIATYNPSGGSGGSGLSAPAGTVYNRGSIWYVQNYFQGPFFVNAPNMEEIHVNIVAENGLWVDDGINQFASSIKGIIEIIPADENGDPVGFPGSMEEHPFQLDGSKFRRDTIGLTVKITPSFTGRYILTIYRTSVTVIREDFRSWQDDNRSGTSLYLFIDDDLSGNTYFRRKLNNVDEIRLMHAYSVSVPKYYPSPTQISDFGEITTVHCRRVQRKSLRAQEPERRLNMTVTRKLPIYLRDTEEFFATLTATTTGFSALFDVLRSERLGNIPDAKIDFNGIYDAFLAVDTAFADVNASAFSHTFDNKEASVEEMIEAIGQACFVTVYREGDIIKALPDVSTEDAALLFNHRNKWPGSETQNVNFDTEEEYDGVEIEYSNNVDDQIQLYTIPATGEPRNPQKIRVAGVRTKIKAAMHAWRAHQKLVHQNTVVEFEACEEASMGLVNERILVADNTNPNTQDGYIVAQDGLDLYTSQQVLITGGETIFLQGYQGSCAAIPITAGPTSFSVTLGSAVPSGIIRISEDNEGDNTRYIIVTSANNNSVSSFRVLDKQQRAPGKYSIQAYNYTDAYYFYDGLQVWLPFKGFNGHPPVDKFADRGPYELDITQTDFNGTVEDPDRGEVYLGTDPTDSLTTDGGGLSSNRNYTITGWFYQPDGEDAFTIARGFTDADSPVIFQVLTSPSYSLRVIHDVSIVGTVDAGIAELWNFYAAVYDKDAETLTIYVNNETSTTFTSVATHAAFDHWQFLNSLVDANADDLRVYRVAKSAQFIQELFLAGRNGVQLLS